MQTPENKKNLVSDRLSQLEDSEIVRLACLQLPYVTTAYEVLFHRYHNKLIQICYRYLDSTEEAEEAVNDTMLNVFNNLKRFEQRASFKTWIYRIAYNQALTRLRKKKLDQVDLDETHEEVSDDTSDDSADRSSQLNSMLERLSLEERSIVVFRIAGDLEFNDIALIVDQKLSTVKMRYKRALEKMAGSASTED
ncbi:sigma-70 family RNA polymerase sigma factor [Pseudocolwellia sp. AS88]|uniref:sigma-70 family RNA polymerase sigma factor n=1 Tax=Pseudocolwellia sp. AS88 TaxID=3063958 RepID=UPI0026F2CA15|nr:sigma-70 family RNA polymerase sigma factor [Pseudocolwellia sp. AS88]MDO7085276.1 sigma-70 family RNA polymerase sigma factor [Pseudocolwellia sp. AS88]